MFFFFFFFVFIYLYFLRSFRVLLLFLFHLPLHHSYVKSNRSSQKRAQLTQGWCCPNECLSECTVCPAGVRRISSVAAHGLGLRVSILLGVRLYFRTVVCSVVFCTYRQGCGPFLGPWSSASYQNELMF